MFQGGRENVVFLESDIAEQLHAQNGVYITEKAFQLLLKILQCTFPAFLRLRFQIMLDPVIF